MNADAPTVDPTLFQYIADWPWYGQLIGFLAILAVPTFAWWMGKRGAAKAAPLILLGALALMLAGCFASPQKEFVSAAEAYYNATSPEYMRYVEGDDSLSPESKDARRGSDGAFRDAIAKAKKESAE